MSRGLQILIVDDHMIIRRGLMQILMEDPRIDRADEAASGPAALQALRARPYDAILLDIALGERDGMDVLKSVRAEFPAMGVVMLSVYPAAQFAVRALRQGAHAYLTKDCQPETLLAALVSAAAGRMHLTPEVGEMLAQNVRHDTSRPPHELLSNREFQVLQLLASGLSVTAIGERLALSANTISTYRGRIFEKLNVRSLAELIAYADTHQIRAL